MFRGYYQGMKMYRRFLYILYASALYSDNRSISTSRSVSGVTGPRQIFQNRRSAISEMVVTSRTDSV